MLTIKLTPINYILWKSQVLPLFAHQDLLTHIDGTTIKPPATVMIENKPTPNPLLNPWITADRKTVILLNATLSEEALAVTVGLETAREMWLALEQAYSNTSVERAHNLRDELRNLSKGTSTVGEFGRKFKFYCDQLAAIGHQASDTEILHWFTCGLGPLLLASLQPYGQSNQHHTFVT